MSEIRFCEKCGGELYHGRCMECGMVYTVQENNESFLFNRHTESTENTPADKPIYNNRRYSKIFMKPDEKFIYAFGNNYLETFLSTGALGNGFAVISDKRVYFKGKMFNLGEGKVFVMSQESKVVDLKDITGTSVMSTYKPWMMPLGTAMLVMSLVIFIIMVSAVKSSGVAVLMLLGSILFFLAGIALYIIDVFNRRNLLKIEFAGGCIAFKVKLYSASDCTNFQKQLSIAKDNAIEEAENAAANAMRSAMQGIQMPVAAPQTVAGGADELLKYAQLVEKGLMTQEEFANIKAKLLANK